MNETALAFMIRLNTSSKQELRGGKMTIPTDIVAAFILLVIFNFGMNLFLFYKWHKEINWEDEYKQSVADAQESNPLI